MTAPEVNSVTIYHNPRCSKSREALALLEHKLPNVDVNVIKYLDSPPNQDELARLLRIAGLRPIDAIRTKEPEFKELGLSKDSSDQELLTAMAAHPKLIERPLVVTDKGVCLARPAELIEEIL